jgi:hypothetical protein
MSFPVTSILGKRTSLSQNFVMPISMASVTIPMALFLPLWSKILIFISLPFWERAPSHKTFGAKYSECDYAYPVNPILMRYFVITPVL